MFSRKLIPLLLFLLVLSGCGTYYQRNRKFNEAYERGQMERALKQLEENEKQAEKKNRLLYFMNLGLVHHQLGNWEVSNIAFEQAYLVAEDLRKNYLAEAASFLTNRQILPYAGEDHELLLIHYYKAMNFLQLKDYSAALVETRRLNNKLNVLADKYTSEKKFERDAFVLNLMGIIYQASGDWNNAFIAYRNAYETYRDDYGRFFNIAAPKQLKEDLIRSAWKTGFKTEARAYEELFKLQYEPKPDSLGNVVFFWHTGLGPVKEEISINFAVVQDPKAGFVHFTNPQWGEFSFPMSKEEQEQKGLGNVHVVRAAFPKYQERLPLYTQGRLVWNDQTEQLELAEDISAVASKALQDRMVKELSTGLMRLALKKAAEYAIREQNQDVGAAVGIFNAVTEQADTRNWSTLPHSIHYGRLWLPPGEHEVKLITSTGGEAKRGREHEFVFNIAPKETVIKAFHTLGTR